VALARLDHKLTSVAFADPTRDGASEMAMAKPIENDLADPIKRIAELRAAGL
jgi:hypothetical protein